MSALVFTQGCYYFISGGWSLVDIDSFQKLTGSKTDLWLVKTVGLLLMAIGAGLILAGIRRQFEPALVVIAMGSAAIEAGFLIGWAACLLTA